MRCILLGLLLLQSCVTVSGLTKSSDEGTVYQIEPAGFDEIKDQHHERVTIIEVGAQWCRPCRDLKPELEQLALAKRGDYQIAIVDIGNNLEFLEEEKIYELPAWYIYLPGRADPIRTDGPMLERIERLVRAYPDIDEQLISELQARVKKADPDRVSRPIPRIMPKKT